MKHGRKQCKDIPDKEYLLAILYAKWKRWGNNPRSTASTWDVQRYLADQLDDIRPLDDNRPYNCDYDQLDTLMPYKLVVAKAKTLIHRGLIDGCGCGCRGDFALTDAGLHHLTSN